MNTLNNYFTGLPFLLLRRFFAVSSLKRFLFFFSADTIIIAFSLYLSFLLRFDFKLTLEFEVLITRVLPLFLVLKLSAFALFRMYKITWRYVGLSDLQNIVLALTASESLLMVLILIPLPFFLTSQLPSFLNFGLASFNFSTGFPRSIFLIDWTISLVLLSGLRISKRVFLEIVLKKRFTKTGKRTIIIGAGNTGEMILRDIARQNYNDFCPAGFLDDDKRKIGTYIHGVKVIGSTDRLKDSIRKYDAEAVIIAIPALNHKLLKDFYETSKAAKIGAIKIVPRIYDFHKPDINLKSLEDISIEDLIGRQAVEVNYSEIEHFIKDRVVLITGAGGSIGSEITIQVCSFNPARVFLLDIDETGLHNMEMKLNKIFPGLLRSVSGQKQGVSSSSAHLTPENRISFIVADIKDKDKISRVFETLRPQIVFHAAAYKHVPMMEYNSDEAVKVNILGTYNLATTATEYGTEKFIMISTDKAVMPTSVMGATKRVAEYICKAFNECGMRNYRCEFNSEPRTPNSKLY